MSERPVCVSADDLHAASEQAAAWEQAVRRAEGGETVAVLAHGRRRRRRALRRDRTAARDDKVLSDNDLLRDLHAGLDDLPAGRVVSADDVAADLRRPAAQ